jgi:FixJ family two-component response regulator
VINQSSENPLGRARILVVDDEPAIRQSMWLLMTARGYDVRSYASATILLADEATLQADCLVTDYMLLDLDGVRLLAQLRREGWRGDAILVTGFATPALRTRATDAGFAAVFEKPVQPQQLVDCVGELVASRTPGAA